MFSSSSISVKLYALRNDMCARVANETAAVKYIVEVIATTRYEMVFDVFLDSTPSMISVKTTPDENVKSIEDIAFCVNLAIKRYSKGKVKRLTALIAENRKYTENPKSTKG
jgi:hypothetical protein